MPFHPTLGERLTQNFPIRQNEQDARDLATYKLFLRFFKERVAVRNLQLNDAKIGVVLVFSAMQSTALKPDCWNYFPSAKRMLERDTIARLNGTEIDALKSFVGGSLIATSKFLHFVNPSRYAMWDANIARAAYRYTWHQCNRSDRYIEYLDDIERLKLESKLRGRIRDAIGTGGALRYKEFALFHLGIAESAPPSAALDLEAADYPFAPEKFTLDLGTDEDGRQ